MMSVLVIFAACTYVANAGECPQMGELPSSHPKLLLNRRARDIDAVKAVDLNAVKADIVKVLTDSKDFWPADYGNYGPFFIRLAWHASGSYRKWDGRGGSDGGHIRFEPEQSWPDNGNLEKARKLLIPIKMKYGKGLSWADLIVFSGTVAIESMGGPNLGFCAGRVDHDDGSESIPLGPNVEQEAIAPCLDDGDCQAPLGANIVGLIYVNPEGPKGNPVPSLSYPQIRDTFDRMGMNDSETVALIGGGHAFGKTHGACPKGPGPSPAEDPENPWPGLCGTGKGNDAAASGFEGPWTSIPTTWSNQYFTNLLGFEWQKHKGPGGKWQWNTTSSGPQAPSAHGTGTDNVMMLTADVALLADVEYKKIVDLYASDMDAFDNAFSHAWYKLTTRDMGPVTRCVGSMVPDVQPWQFPLPTPLEASSLADFAAVRTDLETLMSSDNFDYTEFARLAYRCAATFRITDKRGGCNGARIRFAPEKDWSVNAGLNKALAKLDATKQKFGTGLSWSDLIVLAGNVAVEKAGAPKMQFCGGRTDAVDGDGSEDLAPRVTGAYSDKVVLVKDSMTVMGLSSHEGVALMGVNTLGSIGQGFTGARTSTPKVLSNDYYTNLFSQDWQSFSAGTSQQFKSTASDTANTSDLYMLKTDLSLVFDSELSAVAQEYAADNAKFIQDFAQVWTSLMNADRFDGPTGNICDNSAAITTTVSTTTNSSDNDVDSSDSQVDVGTLVGVAVPLGIIVIVLVVAVVVLAHRKRSHQAPDKSFDSTFMG